MLVFLVLVFNLDFSANRQPLRINPAIFFGKAKAAIVYSLFLLIYQHILSNSLNFICSKSFMFFLITSLLFTAILLFRLFIEAFLSALRFSRAALDCCYSILILNSIILIFWYHTLTTVSFDQHFVVPKQ